MRRTLVLVPVLASLIAPAAASAGTAQMVFTPGDDRTPSSEEFKYAAGPGEANRFTLQEADGTALLVIDSAGVTLGRNCTRPVPGDTTRARCTTTEESSVIEFSVTLGDLDDVGTSTTEVTGSISGGPGNDNLTAPTLDGGEGNDVLKGSVSIKGGPGNDDMTGAPNNNGSDGVTFHEGDANNGSDTIRGQNGGDEFGGDEVSYAGRAEAIRADLRGDRDDGAAGENDMIGANVESITGGNGNDVLTANKKDNRLVGSEGADTLNAGAGDDVLYAGYSNVQSRSRTKDELNGGPGDDTLQGSRGANRLNPGTGRDSVTAGRGADVVLARDRSVDRISCGQGRDGLRVDRLDFFGLGCERARRRGLAAAVPLGLAVFNTGELPYAEIGCSGDAPRRCRGTVTAIFKGRVLSRKRFSVRRGRVGDVNVLGARTRVEGKTVRLRVRSRDRRGRVRQVTVPAFVDPDAG